MVTFETLEVRPAGGLEGHTLRMRLPSVRFLIAQRRGEAKESDYWQAILDAIEEHDLDVDPALLTATLVDAIGVAWIAALKERSVPPASAAR